MSSSTVELIKEKLSIADVVGSYVKLEKAGASMKARCPFHNEKTPSFYVSPARGTYYCFGCGAKGDIISFVEQFEGVDFMGALKTLAERAGVPLHAENPQAKSERDRLFSAMEHAALFFQKNLADSKESLMYLKKRGLAIEMVRDWRIGWAPTEWSLLHSYLRGKGFTDSEMERAGLVKRPDTGEAGGAAGSGGSAAAPERAARFYDRFRGRIMFPLFDPSGRVIAFSGRILVDDGKSAKYLNSPETPLFDKSSFLYGMHKAKLEIRKRDFAIVVEGQMDLLMSQQAGWGNTVAVSGTALTPMHLEALRRLSNTVVLAFDSDKAGFAAALKSAEAALSMGMEVRVADIVSGKDPADLVLSDPEAWKQAVEKAKHVVVFVLERLLRNHAAAQAAGDAKGEPKDERALGREIRAKVLPFVARVESTIERAQFVTAIAAKAGIREDALWEELKKIPREQAAMHASSQAARSPAMGTGSSHAASTAPGVAALRAAEGKGVRRRTAARALAGMVLWQEKMPVPAIDPAKLRINIVTLVGDIAAADLFEQAMGEGDELIFETELLYGSSGRLAEEAKELVWNLAEDTLKEKQVAAMNALQKAQRNADKLAEAENLQKFNELSKELERLKKERNEGGGK